MNQASNHRARRNTTKAIITVLTVIALTLLGTGAGFADTLNLQKLPSNTFHDYYVGETLGNLNGAAQMGFICDDFAAHTSVPSSFAVTVSTISDVSDTRWQDQQKYMEAAWLLSEMVSNPDKVGIIQFAIWEIFDAKATPDYGQAAWVTKAENAVKTGSYDYSSLRIYTPVGNVNQEFMSGGTSPVPVPASVLLFAPALIGLVGFRKRLKK